MWKCQSFDRPLISNLSKQKPKQRPWTSQIIQKVQPTPSAQVQKNSLLDIVPSFRHLAGLKSSPAKAIPNAAYYLRISNEIRDRLFPSQLPCQKTDAGRLRRFSAHYGGGSPAWVCGKKTRGGWPRERPALLDADTACAVALFLAIMGRRPRPKAVRDFQNWKHQPMSFLQGAFLHCHRLMMLAHDNACVTSATTEATNSVPIPTTPVYPPHR